MAFPYDEIERLQNTVAKLESKRKETEKNNNTDLYEVGFTEHTPDENAVRNNSYSEYYKFKHTKIKSNLTWDEAYKWRKENGWDKTYDTQL